MSSRIDPSPYAPPAVSSLPEPERRAIAANEDQVRLLPGWLWLFPAIGVLSAPVLFWIDLTVIEVPLLGAFAPAILVASVTFVCVIGTVDTFRRASFAWTRGRRVAATWFAAIGTAGGLAAVYLGILAAIFAWVSLRPYLSPS